MSLPIGLPARCWWGCTESNHDLAIYSRGSCPAAHPLINWCRPRESNSEHLVSKTSASANWARAALLIDSRERLTIIGGCISGSRCDATDLSIAPCNLLTGTRIPRRISNLFNGWGSRIRTYDNCIQSAAPSTTRPYPINWSAWLDSNQWQLGSKPRTLTRLSYTQMFVFHTGIKKAPTVRGFL